MWYRFRPYVPVAQRRAQASAYAKKLATKEKRALAPVNIEGRKIADSFWGAAWCDSLEAHSDFENRLPRGRTYVRNGSVIDLQISRGKIKALVSGSEVYQVSIEIATLAKPLWQQVKDDCARSIGSMLDLFAGRFDDSVMKRLTRPDDGLFPKPREIKMKCSCPDWAVMCKHCAAVLYGIGARLDTQPELLFLLRGVDQTELIGQAVSADNLDRALAGTPEAALSAGDLGAMFGIDLANDSEKPAEPPPLEANHHAPAKTVRKKAAAGAAALAKKKAKPVKASPEKIKAKPTQTAKRGA